MRWWCSLYIFPIKWWAKELLRVPQPSSSHHGKSWWKGDGMMRWWWDQMMRQKKTWWDSWGYHLIIMKGCYLHCDGIMMEFWWDPDKIMTRCNHNQRLRFRWYLIVSLRMELRAWKPYNGRIWPTSSDTGWYLMESPMGSHPETSPAEVVFCGTAP